MKKVLNALVAIIVIILAASCSKNTEKELIASKHINQADTITVPAVLKQAILIGYEESTDGKCTASSEVLGLSYWWSYGHAMGNILHGGITTTSSISATAVAYLRAHGGTTNIVVSPAVTVPSGTTYVPLNDILVSPVGQTASSYDLVIQITNGCSTKKYTFWVQ